MRALIVGTGPSLSEVTHLIPKFDGIVFTCNNCPDDPVFGHATDVWLACDPAWHKLNGRVDFEGRFDAWHWSSDICAEHGYKFVEGIWMDGLYMGPENKISLNHCSGAQLLNLAANQYECDEIVLIGHDFHYNGPQRHYFDGLSDVVGEYPAPLRKYSQFEKNNGTDDLMAVYKRIAEQDSLPKIINCTKGSALKHFPMGEFENYLR